MRGVIVGVRIKARIEAIEGMSQSELARRVGITQGTIAALISGRSRSSTYLHQIARELGTTPSYLSGETDDLGGDVPRAPDLSYDELAWVHYWRALHGDERDAMVRVVRLLIGDRIQTARAA
jgi:transcriptional regulator with XRE-family HTH domain